MSVIIHFVFQSFSFTYPFTFFSFLNFSYLLCSSKPTSPPSKKCYLFYFTIFPLFSFSYTFFLLGMSVRQRSNFIIPTSMKSHSIYVSSFHTSISYSISFLGLTFISFDIPNLFYLLDYNIKHKPLLDLLYIFLHLSLHIHFKIWYFHLASSFWEVLCFS